MSVGLSVLSRTSLILVTDFFVRAFPCEYWQVTNMSDTTSQDKVFVRSPNKITHVFFSKKKHVLCCPIISMTNLWHVSK